MKKISALTLGLALAAAGTAFAGTTTAGGDAGSEHHAAASMHQLGQDVRGALHKLGDATRHAIHRADAAVHHDRGATHDRNA